MNLFPNLQIHIHNYPDSNQSSIRSSRQTRRHSSASSINPLTSLLSSVLRRQETEPVPEDVQFYFTFDNTSQQFQGLRLEDLPNYTQLFVLNEMTENEMCSICRNQFQMNEICRKINQCQHYFHQSCVDSWLSRNSTCPVCRHSILPLPNSSSS